MRNTSAGLLEFEELKKLLARYVASERGRTELAALTPGTDRAAIEESLAETGEGMAYLAAASHPQPASRGAAIRLRFDTMPEIGPAVARLSIEGASLDATEILQLTEVLDRAADTRAVLSATSGRFPKLAGRAAAIGEFRGLLEDLAGKILPDGTVADHASVALNRIRRDIERQQRSIQESLERFLRAHRQDGILQEEFITIRNDRFVVPLVAGQQRKIEGVVHAASGTGHTLFVEPLDTIELNNDLVRLHEEELREVHRILREMTQRIRGHAGDIAATYQVLGELELIFAKASFAVDFDCIVPRFSGEESRRLRLKDARHPLLEDVLRRQRRKPVPVSLELDDATRTLLISGPNTGGKTVTLKTVGLLALMAQSALPVPCAAAEFPIFDAVLADIGDQQSIQESLSTFSAHISRVRDMLSDVSRDSLVLLDELGRATDPEEGGALGVAVLDHFRQAGAFTLASTHLLALKIYGANTTGVLNGSMGFNDDTLEPTYVLRLGAPGKSAGLDIGRRLGLPEDLIRQARQRMSTSERDIAQFLRDLHARLEEVSEDREMLRQRHAELEAREKELAKEWERRESAKLKELERRTDLLMEKFEQNARETINQIHSTADQRKAAEQAMRRVSKTKREFQEEVRSTVLSTDDESRQGTLTPLKIEPGARVRLRDVREPATVLRKLADGRVEVQAGFMKFQVTADDVLEVLPSAGETAKLPKNVTFTPGPTWNVLSREVNVIGRTAEEALAEVDKFLDSASMASVDRVRIIHGHGMGILKRAVAEFLKNHPQVAKFYPASPAEGGTGATIAELR